MTKSIFLSTIFHIIIITLSAISFPYMLKKPIDLPPIISIELIQISDITNIPYAPKARKILDKIKNTKEPVVFISGHFNNFELMAMQIEKSGINLAAIYRPLNNIFLNKIMERIRKKYICRKQIKKGSSGTRDLLKSFKKNYSIALMIDQRVSESIKIDFFGQKASTTTIPAQLVKKFGSKIVPIYIERINGVYFKMTINKPISFDKESTIEEITLNLNKWLEKMILINPGQWIWSHDRWK